MMNPLTKAHRWQFFLFALLLVAGGVTAKHHHGRYLSPYLHHRRAWGVQRNAQFSLSTTTTTTTTTTQRQREILDSYLMQLRGGSSDYRGSGDNYYDSQSSSHGRSSNNNNDDRGRYDQGGYDRDERYDRGGTDKQGGNQDSYAGDRGGNKGVYDGYDDQGRAPSRSNDAVKSSLSNMQSKLKNGDRRIGVPLLGLGVVFTMLGVSLFFNKALMRLGNLMFIAGVPATIGPTRTAGYFLNPKKARATACLCAGIFLVFVGWPIFGIALEVFGILNLFGNMFPMFWAIFKNMPFVSSITKNAGPKSKSSDSSYGGGRDRGYSSDNDPYYEDRRGYEYGDGEGEKYY